MLLNPQEIVFTGLMVLDKKLRDYCEYQFIKSLCIMAKKYADVRVMISVIWRYVTVSRATGYNQELGSVFSSTCTHVVSYDFFS